MLFVEFSFLPFFLLVFCVHWALRSHLARKLWLLLASYCFYAAWDWRFLGLILASTLIDYGVGRRLHAGSHKRFWLGLSLCANLGLLGFFKYYNFFMESGIELIQLLGFEAHPSTLRIILPVGISFYTFQTLSYSIDVYRGKLQASDRLADFALFVAFFPQLVAGPIIRAIDFMPQLKVKTIFRRSDLRAALVLFTVGFIKKACVSDGIAQIPDEYFGDPAAYNALAAWIGTLFYAVQIYCDFSGYTDMAIACAALLGYELCVNFRFPYLAADITDFWRRWHISLSSWLRDYLYIPLGGNRGSSLFQARNLILTMLLGGLWHGAGWNFLLWGGLHGAALMLHKLWSQALPESSLPRRVTGFLGPLLTFGFVCLCWIFFRATDFDSARSAAMAFLGLGASGLPGLESVQPAWAFGLLAGLALAHWVASRHWTEAFWRALPRWGFTLALALLWALALPFVPLESKPFIYFQF